MREIKFRARSANIPRCWIYGYFVIEDGCNYIINDEGKFKVIAGTEGQYTGLKDKNLKEIYDGDIVQTFHGIFEVKELEATWYLQKENMDGGFTAQRLWDAFMEFPCKNERIPEVIGNIYKNPELLKSK